MPEVANIVFSYKEVVIALLKAHNIHEGIWALFVRFGLNAANVGPTEERNPADCHYSADGDRAAKSGEGIKYCSRRC